MKITIYKIAASAVLCLALHTASAQNLDPTVVINKAYEGSLIKVRKPSFEMAVPDSLTRFNLDFDYLVSEKPYKGADEFNPYVLTMKPAPMVRDMKSFYLRAGAGYTLHPTLDLVWSPFGGGKFSMDVYAKHRSYVGAYKTLLRRSLSDEIWKGYDLKSEAGVNARLETASSSWGMDVSYYGLASKDWMKQRMYDALNVQFGVKSKPANSSYVKYDIQAAYRFAGDRLNYASASKGKVGEHILDVDATIGRVIGEHHRIMVDAGVDFAAYKMDTISPVVGQVTLAPRYEFKKGRFTIDAGVRLSKTIRSAKSYEVFDAREQIVYPDVHAYFNIIPDAMRVYAIVGGGSKLNTYASLLERNHHVDPTFAMAGASLMNLTVERVSASLGLEGRIGSIFSYNLRAGYVNYASDLLDAVYISQNPITGIGEYVPGVGYASYQKYFAAVDWCMLNDNIRFDGNVHYDFVWGLEENSGLFMPAHLKGDVSFEYNWSRRIFAGVDCEFSTARLGTSWVRLIPVGAYRERIPGYVDLGVYFEYAVNRSFSIWAHGGNLLNMTIQRNPLYAEKGLSLTAGICLNL